VSRVSGRSALISRSNSFIAKPAISARILENRLAFGEITKKVSSVLDFFDSVYAYICFNGNRHVNNLLQEALLLQRNRTTRLSAEILQNPI